MKEILIALSISCQLAICNGEILPCKKSVESKLCFFADNIHEYVKTISPEPIPTLINITITINDIFEVDEEKKSVTLAMKIILEWFDFRLDVKRSKEENKMYVLLTLDMLNS